MLFDSSWIICPRKYWLMVSYNREKLGSYVFKCFNFYYFLGDYGVFSHQSCKFTLFWCHFLLILKTFFSVDYLLTFLQLTKNKKLLVGLGKIFLKVCLIFDSVLLTSTSISTDFGSSPTEEFKKLAIIKVKEHIISISCQNYSWKIY